MHCKQTSWCYRARSAPWCIARASNRDIGASSSAILAWPTSSSAASNPRVQLCDAPLQVRRASKRSAMASSWRMAPLAAAALVAIIALTLPLAHAQGEMRALVADAPVAQAARAVCCRISGRRTSAQCAFSRDALQIPLKSRRLELPALLCRVLALSTCHWQVAAFVNGGALLHRRHR